MPDGIRSKELWQKQSRQQVTYYKTQRPEINVLYSLCTNVIGIIYYEIPFFCLVRNLLNKVSPFFLFPSISFFIICSYFLSLAHLLTLELFEIISFNVLNKKSKALLPLLIQKHIYLGNFKMQKLWLSKYIVVSLKILLRKWNENM